MKITPVRDKELIARVKGKPFRSRIREVIEEFMASGETMAEVDNSGYATPWICASTIAQAIKNARIGGVAARTYKGKTYIYRTDEDNEIETQNCSTK